MEVTEVQHIQNQLKEEQRQNKNREEQRQLEIQQYKKLYEEECQQNTDLRNELHERDRQAVITKCRKDDSEDIRKLKLEKEKYDLKSVVYKCSDTREKLRLKTENDSYKSNLATLTSRLRDADATNKQYEKELVDYKQKVKQMEETIKQMQVWILMVRLFL